MQLGMIDRLAANVESHLSGPRPHGKADVGLTLEYRQAEGLAHQADQRSQK
jgi:hypothetical protein